MKKMMIIAVMISAMLMPAQMMAKNNKNIAKPKIENKVDKRKDFKVEMKKMDKEKKFYKAKPNKRNDKKFKNKKKFYKFDKCNKKFNKFKKFDKKRK